MSLDATLENINDTLQQVASLLKAVEVAVFILAIAVGIALIGCTAGFFYGKYNQRYQYKELSSGSPSNSTTPFQSPMKSQRV
ncbi:IMV envelope protein [Caenorhabditis elegans]|uniref:IMV envelope protein n=1 Tax=Caenorhabditis elegans TaxID=6239 RepID=G5EDQ7_CAEEL|nr:IMV envelope protein [Caenorhabditis elegans]CAC35861.2 IMV envelope protein [Caenorhabditis elegans]